MGLVLGWGAKAPKKHSKSNTKEGSSSALNSGSVFVTGKQGRGEHVGYDVRIPVPPPLLHSLPMAHEARFLAPSEPLVDHLQNEANLSTTQSYYED